MDFGKIYEKKREVKKTDKVKHLVICAFAVLLVILFSLDGGRLFIGFSEMLGLCDKRDKAVAAIDFINVGQGSCSLISSDNEYALVDTGTETYEGIAPFNRLKNYGAGSIKYVFITHCHSDHIGGLFGLISNFKVENVVVYDKPVGDEAVGFYQKASEYCEQYGVNVICPQNGMEFKVGKGSITAYIPPNGLLIPMKTPAPYIAGNSAKREPFLWATAALPRRIFCLMKVLIFPATFWRWGTTAASIQQVCGCSMRYLRRQR